MANFDLAFQPENGINLDGLVGIFTGIIDPSIVGEAAPIGSLYLSTSGRLYQKVTALDTGWMVFSQGLGEALKISATDTTAGYLNTKLLTSAALTKTVGNAGANETLTLDLASVGTAGTYRSVTTNSKGQVTAGTNPTTLSGYGITDAQPLATNLTALAGVATTGLYVRQTAGGTTITRTIVGTTNQINVLAGDGVSGNPTLSFSSTVLFPGTTGIRPPSGTTAQRVATASYLRFNTTTAALEYYNGTTWVSLVASTGGTVTSISTVAPTEGLTITGGPITAAGTLTFTLANDLAALESIATTGFSARIGTDTWAARNLTGTLDRLEITNGAGVAGDPTFDIASTYAGQSSIITLGNITTGSWAATTIDIGHGGTGRTSIGGANTVLGVNTTATALEYKVIVGGTGISVSPTANQLQITNSGVTSVTGTTNQVNVSGSTGSITFSLPQSIATTSTPTFAQVTVAADPAAPLQLATKQYVDNAVQGLDAKQSVAAATTTNITLSGEQTIDNVALDTGDRVLVKNQTTASQNGIYVVSSGAWTRALDLDTWAEAVDAFTFVEGGIALAGTGWIANGSRTGTIDTTAMPWVQFSQAGVVNAGGGLTQSGTTISLSPVGTAGTYNDVTTNAYGQVISGTNQPYLTANQNITLQGDVTGVGNTLITTALSATGVAPGTYKSVTVDAKGRIGAATNPTTLAGYGITDAQPINAYLTALSGLATNGIVIRSGNTTTTRTIDAGSTKVSVNFADGVAGNPTIDVVEANLALNNISGTLAVSKGGTGLSAVNGANTLLGVNASSNALEYKALTGTGITITHSPAGINFTTINNGTVTSVAATGSTGLTVGGTPITSAGTLTFTLSTELQALSGLATLGFVSRTAANTYVTRSVVSGNATISISNPAGSAGNVSLDLATVGTAGTFKSVTTDIYGRVTSGTNPTTLAGYGITDAAPNTLAYLTVGSEPTLTNERRLAGTTSQITLADNGANSTLVIGLAADAVLPGTGSVTVPAGTTAQRTPAPAVGASRFNTDLLAIEYWDGSTWQPVGRQTFVDAKFPMGFYDRLGESTLAVVAGTRTFTITPIGAHFTYYHSGTRIEKTTAESVVWPNSSGMWYFSYSAAGVLTASGSFYDLATQVPAANLYWDATNQKILTFADERHGATMDWATHQYLHLTVGPKYYSGLQLGNYTTAGTGTAAADAELSLTSGVLFDEDLRIAITHSATPTSANEQNLTPIAQIPVFYRIGAGVANWQGDTASNFPIKFGTARARYNLNTAGTWSLADVGEGEYLAMWVFASNGYTDPVFAMMGQRTDTTLQNAIDNNLFSTMDFGAHVSAESKLLYRLIYQTSSAYTNAVKARLVDVHDMRTTTELTIAATSLVDHSDLAGLNGDDHIQYVHLANVRTISAQHIYQPITAAAPFALGANAQGQLVTGFNADTVDGLHAASFQAADADLTAIAALTGTGIAVRTAADTWTTRTLVAPAAGLTIANPAGIAAGPTFALADDLNALEALATTGLAVRTGTSAWTTRTLVAGTGITIANTDGVAGNITISAPGGSGVTSVALALPSIFTVSGSPITTTGTLTGTLATQAQKTVFAGPTSGVNAAPTFRTLALANDLSDVVVTTPTVGQVLAYDNTTSKWVNAGAVGTSAAGLIGAGQAGAAAWTLSSGTRYFADFTHGLGTTNVVITVYDTATNAVVIPDSIILTTTTTVRVTVIGNTRTLRVVVVANGNSVTIGGGGGGGNVAIAKDGATVVATASTINFRGAPITVADAGAGTANVTIGARYSFMAHSLDTPNTADYAVNAIAAATTDPTSTSLSVRSFSNTVEQGVAFQVSIPANATTMTLKIRGRAATAPGAVNVVQPRLYSRVIPNNAAMGAWSAAFELNNISIPTNAFFQYSTQTIPLTTLGITADSLYQFELTRRITGVTGTNLASAFYMVELICEFS